MSDVTTMTELPSRSMESARESGLAPELFEMLAKGLLLGSQPPDPEGDGTSTPVVENVISVLRREA